MNGFVSSRIPIDANDAVLSMGYYTRADLSYYYAMADAFTICDNYFCSVMGPTDPNRLYTMAASLDPDGKNGGPILQSIVTNRSAFFGRLTYTTMPEQLQARGVSWKVYSSPDETVLGGILSNNVLSYFKNFQDPASVLHQNGFGPQFPIDFLADVVSGNLPQVSWLVGSVLTSDHPPAPSLFGEILLSLIVSALTANPPLWAKTVLIVTYDENGGFFDHVAPVTAPLGTPGEYVTAAAVPDPTVVGSPAITSPIGLGFRVPTLIISPFSRGGFVSSDLFDHTSVLRFLETRFGAEVPNLSAWRRATVGDLTSVLNFKILTSRFRICRPHFPANRRRSCNLLRAWLEQSPTQRQPRRPSRLRNPEPRLVPAGCASPRICRNCSCDYPAKQQLLQQCTRYDTVWSV
jgi:phospholipase C